MTADELKNKLELHAKWLCRDATGVRANLGGADLGGADLGGANIRGADLGGANLGGANIRGADLGGANLGGANLGGADLGGANLWGANLWGADLGGANLWGARLPRFQIPQGELVGYKKLSCGAICELTIPREARRTASLVGRKCRAEWVVVVSGQGVSTHDSFVRYTPGEIVRPDAYDDDIRVECTHGIHFFCTREEAEEY